MGNDPISAFINDEFYSVLTFDLTFKMLISQYRTFVV